MLVLGVLSGLGLAMSTRMRDALVEGLGRRSLGLGLAGGAGVATVHGLWLGLATLVGAGSADDLGAIGQPLGVVGAGILLAVAADVALRAVILGPTSGSPRALPDRPVVTFFQMLVIAALDPRALAVLFGWLAVTPRALAGIDPAPVVIAAIVAVAGWWALLAAIGASGRSGSRFRRWANVAGAILLAVLAALVLLG
jgi:hypothetical protein